MTRRILTLVLALWPGLAAAQQQPTPEQMKAMMEQMKAGPEHRTLAALEGKWTADVTYSMGTGQSMKARGTATNRMILGGRFLESNITSDNPAGSGFGDAKLEGVTIYGFDRRTNQYTVLALDTMGTYWVSAAGSMNADKAIVMSGETQDDHSGSKELRKYDMVLKVVGPDTYITEIIFKFPNMPDLKIVEAVHRRVK